MAILCSRGDDPNPPRKMIYWCIAYQQHMSLTPLPCFISKSASTENGVYCTGCALRAKEHSACYGLGRRGHSHFDGIRNTITKAEDIHCWMGRIRENCILYTARDKLFDSREKNHHSFDARLSGFLQGQLKLRTIRRTQGSRKPLWLFQTVTYW